MTDRELDLLVAQHVFGWTEVRAVSYGFTSNDGLPPGKKRKGDRQAVPHYSTTGDGMLAVIERAAKLGKKVTLHTGLYGRCRFDADCGEDDEGLTHEASDDSAPRAVALATLKAMGVEIAP